MSVLTLPEEEVSLLEQAVLTATDLFDLWEIDTAPPTEEPVRWAVPGVWDDQPAGPVLRVGNEVAQLEAAVAAVESVDPSQLDEGQALAELERLEQLQQRLRALLLPRVADAERRQLFRHRGFHGMKGWLAETAPDATAADRTLAHRLDRYRHVQGAVQQNRLSLRAATAVTEALGKVVGYLDAPSGCIDGQPAEPVIASIVDNTIALVAQGLGGLDDDDVRLEQVRAGAARIQAAGGSQAVRVEQAFTLLAEHLTDERTLKAALDQQVHAVLPNLLEKEQEAAEARRGLSVKQRTDGAWDVKGRLTAECGERFVTALGAEARRDPANPEDTRARELARDAAAAAAGVDRFEVDDVPAWEKAAREPGVRDEPLVPRTRSRRLHDALDRMLTRYLEHGLGGEHDKVPVQVTATVSSDLIEGAPGALPARAGSGMLLARSVLRGWWCDSQVTALVMSQGWKPLGVAHTGRTLTGLERKASLTQHGNRCSGLDCCPGTPDPLIPLVPHHLYDHATHGRTSIGETAWLCPTGHHDIHTGKKLLRLRDGRLINENGVVQEHGPPDDDP